MSSQPTGVNPKLVDVDSTLFKAAGTLLQLQAVLGAFYGLAEAREGKLREDDQAWTIIEVCQMLANKARDEMEDAETAVRCMLLAQARGEQL